MRTSGGSGGSGTIVVDITGVRRASGMVGDAGQELGLLGRRIASHPLPEMPAGVAAEVIAAITDASAALGTIPQQLIDIAQELRVRAFWAEIADQLTAGHDLSGAALSEFKAAYASGLLIRYAEPWQAQLAKAYAQKVHDHEHPGGLSGFFHDAGEFFSGAWDSIKDPAVMIYHLTPLSGNDWEKNWGDLGQSLETAVTHPVAFGKAIANLDALHKRGFSYWLGNLAPAVAATLLSGGAAAAVRGADGAVALDRVAEGALAVDRAAATTRLVKGSSDLADLESTAARADRLDYGGDFADSLDNFEGGQALLYTGPLERDLVLVQYYDGDRATGSLKWWTTTEQANGMPTVASVHEDLALPPVWGDRNSVHVAVIPKGTNVEYLSGRAALQSTEDGATFSGGGEQLRFRDFDPKWIHETRHLP